MPTTPRAMRARRSRTQKDENDLRISRGLGLSNNEMGLLERVKTARAEKSLRDTSASDLVAT